MRLLDLFCGAGGAAVGYHRAGFDEIVGVDIKPQPRYPFQFVQADALEFCQFFGAGFDAIHASPPCQAYSVASNVHKNAGKVYPALIPLTVEAVQRTGKAWVIENVELAPLTTHVLKLCGLSFGLPLFRHRLFRTSFVSFSPSHVNHIGKRIGEGYYSIAGAAGRWKTWGTVQRNVSKGSRAEWRDAMDLQFMTRHELTQAIPPAYTEFIGKQLLQALRTE